MVCSKCGAESEIKYCDNCCKIRVMEIFKANTEQSEFVYELWYLFVSSTYYLLERFLDKYDIDAQS